MNTEVTHKKVNVERLLNDNSVRESASPQPSEIVLKASIKAVVPAPPQKKAMRRASSVRTGTLSLPKPEI